MLDILETNNGYQVTFQDKPWLVEAIKQIPGAEFRQNDGKKFWWVPASSGGALLNWAKGINGNVSTKPAALEIGEIEPLPELTIDIPLKMSLFPYQRNGVAYGINKKRIINGDDMGLGKTAQTIATLTGAGAKCILVICPATLKENWKREWKMWTGKDAMVLNDRVKNTWPQYYKVGMINVFICNYESLKKYFVQAINKPEDKPLRLNHIIFKETIDLFDAVVIDEMHRCLPYESKILTNRGWIQIGEIVEQGLSGLLVASYNTFTNKVSLKKIKNLWKNDLGDRKLYRIRHDKGELYATGNHKIYLSTGRKKEVCEIEAGEELCLLSEDFLYSQGRESNSSILLENLRREACEYTASCKRSNKKSQRKAFASKNMRLLQSAFHQAFKRQAIRENKILHTELLSQVENGPTGSAFNESKSNKSREIKTKRIEANAKSVIERNAFRKNEVQQSNAQARNFGKGKISQCRKNISFKRREWQSDCSTDNSISRFRFTGISNGVSYKNEASKGFVSKPAKLLQSRYWNRRNKISNRGGWAEPQHQKMEVFGQKKNGNIECVRVESVTIHQPRCTHEYAYSSIKNKIVYDLEIADNHNYFADGILVSNCKDYKTQLSKFCMGIAKDKEYIIGLTGTPVVNKPMDLLAQLQIIGRLGEFGGYKGFTDRYCQGFNQSSNLKELNYFLNKTCFFRRLKKEVLNNLPDKMRSIVSCEITTRKDYDKAEAEFISFLRDNLNKTEGEISTALRGEAMVKMGILKKLSAKGKIDAMIEQIREVVEAGEKIIVFATHKDVVAELKQAIPGSVTVIGDDSMDQRQRNVDAFQKNHNCQVIICNIQSGGVGITLTASSRVAFIELPWHPAHADQAEDRAWRIGQKNSVQCTYLLGQNTIDEYIYNIIEKKRAMVAQVTGAENDIQTEMSMVDDLIGLFSGKK
jgi:hypothetical protein